MPSSARRVRRITVIAAALSLNVAMFGASSTQAQAGAPASASGSAPGHSMRSCPPSGAALGFSDALDKLSVDGVTVGGLSSLAYDRPTRTWASTVDNHASDPSRIWFFRDLSDPHPVGSPVVLRRPDGTPYDGSTADNEGLALLPGGSFLVSSETEPSIRVFGRDGFQLASLPIPSRFAVSGTTPEGEATANATLEGLTISPDGRQVVAAMEGALSGDVSSTGDATMHRFLVYRKTPSGWKLHQQLGYQATEGERVPEIAAVGRHDLVVEEASFDPATGNAVQLYAVRGYDRAPDVTDIDNLSTAPSSLLLGKRLLADLVRCPTLGASSKEPQVNPLMDNYEGMAVTGLHRGRHGASWVGVSLVSDDNFSAAQTTRVLNVAVRLRRNSGKR